MSSELPSTPKWWFATTDVLLCCSPCRQWRKRGLWIDKEVIGRCSERLVEPLHKAGDMHKAQKHNVELVKAGGHTAKDFHALEEIFNQVARLVAVLVQGARLLAIGFGRDDDLHALGLRGLDNLV